MKGFMYLIDKRGTFGRAWFAALFSFAFGSAATAQTITSGIIEGVVVDQNAVPLIEVLVQVAPVDGGATRSSLSNREGIFRFSLLPAGRYNLTVERIGYRPVVIEEVRVSANTRVPVEVRLVETPPPVDNVERIRWAGAATGSRAGASQLLSPFALDEVPWERREVNELPRLASMSSRDFEVEGLPSWLSTLRVDGVPYRPARHPFLASDTREIALPINALSVAELVAGDADGEWSGAAGNLSATTRRGSNGFGARAFGSWSGSALRSSELFDPADVSGSSIWGGALFTGSVIPDTAQVVLGFELRNLQTPTASVWGLDESTANAIISAANARGEDVANYALPYAVESTSFSGFGRFDWQLADNNQLSVRAALGSTKPGSSAFDLAAAAMPAATASASDLLLNATLSSILASNWAHEVRVGFTNSSREHSDDDDVLLPSTTIVNGALIGGAQNLLGSFKRSDLTIDQSLQIPFTVHQVKVGLGVGLGLHDNTFVNTTVGDFAFGGATQLGQAQGVYVQRAYASPEVSFSTLHANAFVQDTWQAAPGVQILGGVRVDLQTLPQSDVRAEAAWLTASGLDNTLLDDRAVTVSPRFGLTWDAGSRGNVLVRINAGRFANEIDPLIISDLLVGDGDLTVRRSFGALAAWPGAPSTAVTPTVGTSLALLGPSFRGPQSDRIGVGVSSRLGSLGTLHLSGAYRKTSFLPRRTDLNLVEQPVAQDQHGRPLFGTLTQSGQLLTAAGTNRRFRGYDVVTGISADGSAEYRGITIGLEKDAGRDVRLFGSYTYSQTTDDWPARRSARAEALLSPFPNDVTDGWLEGTSDYDLPHRAVAGLEFAPQMAMQPRITAIYRFQSGYPFTPGFRDGVDANGDGSDSNDPAFVDSNLAGMSELVGQWDCLSSQSGQFAERNSCRGENTNELDVRFGLSVLSGRTTAQLFIEGINLMDASFDEPDRALVLVDPAGSLQR
ncbi:MAG TPA: carboxypeptidase regulatory-like domain-containing protein, partial [Longimicrobiales bacterium]